MACDDPVTDICVCCTAVCMYTCIGLLFIVLSPLILVGCILRCILCALTCGLCCGFNNMNKEVDIIKTLMDLAKIDVFEHGSKPDADIEPQQHPNEPAVPMTARPVQSSPATNNPVENQEQENESKANDDAKAKTEDPTEGRVEVKAEEAKTKEEIEEEARKKAREQAEQAQKEAEAEAQKTDDLWQWEENKGQGD